MRDSDRPRKAGQFRPQELEKYPERRQYKEVPLNKQLEAQFKGKTGQDDREIKAVRGKKSEIIEGMVTKDLHVSPEKRSDDSKDFHYVGTKEFARELKKRNPSTTEKDTCLTVGFHDGNDNQAFVKDRGDTYVTAVHEKLHQKSKSELPTRLNEGITEHFAREKAGALGDLKNINKHGREIPKAKYYEKEVEIAGKLESTIGKKPLNKAYFEGKSDVLKNHLVALSIGDL